MVNKSPMKGMPEQLPNTMRVRNYLLDKIKSVYASYGFQSIETPCIENIENLLSKQGGENEQLIFKILKRGEKLKNANGIDELCDCGLRYDLTLPLSRFYANNSDKLPLPFKSLQFGNVWRADRPQKGRFRQFSQCDIDILGDETNLAEIELISATCQVLDKIGLKEYKIRVNDRRILKAIATKCKFNEKDYEQLFISLDKLDKIGFEGVESELISLNYDEKMVKDYLSIYENSKSLSYCSNYLQEVLKDEFDCQVAQNLDEIISAISILIGENKLQFDPTLVRGMGYYTGPIFEIQLEPYSYSIGGGGRYDEMISKFSGNKVSACGFSLGFERIVDILIEKNVAINTNSKCLVILIDKKLPFNEKIKVMKVVKELRKFQDVLLIGKNKNTYFQKQKLVENGFEKFMEINSVEDIEQFGVQSGN